MSHFVFNPTACSLDGGAVPSPLKGRDRAVRAPRLHGLRLSMLVGLVVVSFVAVAGAIEPAELTDPTHRIAPDDPAWSDLAAAFARKPDSTAAFSEQRFFPFKKVPLELAGEVRISRSRGLSLHYTAPEDRTVILDEQGMLVRQGAGEQPAPADPRANVANAALVHVLRFDLAALAGDFELFGRREGGSWTIALIPRAEMFRRALGEIDVAGAGAEVHRISIRRTPTQHVEILIGPSRPTPFTAEELARFFR